MQGLFALQKSTGKYIGRAAMLPKSYLQANKIPDPTMANHDSVSYCGIYIDIVIVVVVTVVVEVVGVVGVVVVGVLFRSIFKNQ